MFSFGHERLQAERSEQMLDEEEVTERVEDLPQLAEELRIAYMHGNFREAHKLRERMRVTLDLSEAVTKADLWASAVSADDSDE